MASQTRERVLDAAERLIAERGIGNVSVRDITTAAGANTAAVNYHFGSKAGLIEAIIERHAARFGDRRSELLNAVPAAERTLRDIVGAMARAVAELAADRRTGGRRYLQCKQRMHADPTATRLLEKYFAPYTKELLDALAAVTPGLPGHVRVLRFALARDVIDDAFLSPNYADWIRRHGGTTPSHDGYTDEVVDFLVAGLAAPA